MARDKSGLKSNLVLHNPAWQRVLSFLGESDLDSVRRVDKNLHSMVQSHSVYALKRLQYFLRQSVELISSEFVQGCFTSMNDRLSAANFSHSRAENLAVIDQCLGAWTKETSVFDVALAETIRLVIMGQHKDALAHFKANRRVFEDKSDQLLPFAAAFGSSELVTEVFGNNTSLQETIVDAEKKADISDRFERMVVSAIRWACYFGRADSLEILIKARLSHPLPVDNGTACVKEDQIATCFLAAMECDTPRVVSTLLHYNIRMPLHELFKSAIEQGAVKVLHMLFNQDFRNDFFAGEEVPTSQFMEPFLSKAVEMQNGTNNRPFEGRKYLQASHCLRQYFSWIDDYVEIYDCAFTGSVDSARELLLGKQQLLEADLPKESIDRIHKRAVAGKKVNFIHFLMSPNHCDEFNGCDDLLPWPEKFSISMTPGILYDCLEKAVVYGGWGNYYFQGVEFCEMLWRLVERKVIRLLDQIEGEDATWMDYMKKISGNLLLDDYVHPGRVVCLLNEIANGLRVIALQQVESYLDKRKDEMQVKGKKALSFGIRSAIALREGLSNAENAVGIFDVMLQHLGRREGNKGPGFKNGSLDMLIIEAIMMNEHLNRLLVMRLPTVATDGQVIPLVDYTSLQSQCANLLSHQTSASRLWSYAILSANNRRVHEMFTRRIAVFDRYCAGKLHDLLMNHHDDEHSSGQAPE